MCLSSTKKTKTMAETVCTNNFDLCLVTTIYRVLPPQKAVGRMWNGACAINYSFNTFCGENQI